MPNQTDLRLADHFPLVRKSCKKPADKFFECFSTHGVQPPDGDQDAGRKALAECASLMRYYDTCMEKAVKKAPPRLTRVQGEYRVIQKDQ